MDANGDYRTRLGVAYLLGLLFLEDDFSSNSSTSEGWRLKVCVAHSCRNGAQQCCAPQSVRTILGRTILEVGLVGFGENFAWQPEHFGFGSGYGCAVRVSVAREIAARRGLVSIRESVAVRSVTVHCARVRGVTLVVWEFAQGAGLLRSWHRFAGFGV